MLKIELALRCFPHHAQRYALRLLRHAITSNKKLRKELLRAGYRPGSNVTYFTPQQAELIISHLHA